MHESATDDAECRRKVPRVRKVAGATRSLVNARDLHLSVQVLHEATLMPFLMYGSKRMIWKEKERSMVRVVPMDNL